MAQGCYWRGLYREFKKVILIFLRKRYIFFPMHANASGLGLEDVTRFMGLNYKGLGLT